MAVRRNFSAQSLPQSRRLGRAEHVHRSCKKGEARFSDHGPVTRWTLGLGSQSLVSIMSSLLTMRSRVRPRSPILTEWRSPESSSPVARHNWTAPRVIDRRAGCPTRYRDILSNEIRLVTRGPCREPSWREYQSWATWWLNPSVKRWNRLTKCSSATECSVKSAAAFLSWESRS